MRKHKIKGLKSYANLHEEKTVTGADGTEVTYRTHIPYADKIAFAREWAENTIIEHDDSCVYTGYERNLYEMYLTAKYYTDINTDDATPEEIADFLINNNIWNDIEENLREELYEVLDLYNGIAGSVFVTYENDRSLTKAIRTSFGFLFNGEDITQSMAKAEATTGIMVDALNALGKAEKEAKEKPTGGKMNVGGQIINFSRKKE